MSVLFDFLPPPPPLLLVPPDVPNVVPPMSVVGGVGSVGAFPKLLLVVSGRELTILEILNTAIFQKHIKN